jgi:hypothetical protein
VGGLLLLEKEGPEGLGRKNFKIWTRCNWKVALKEMSDKKLEKSIDIIASIEDSISSIEESTFGQALQQCVFS